MRRNKTTGQIQHARLRADQRYGLRLTKDEVQQIAKAIHAQDLSRCQFVHVISSRLSVWRVAFKGCSLLVAYDKLRHNIATVLPPDWTPDWKERRSA